MVKNENARVKIEMGVWSLKNGVFGQFWLMNAWESLKACELVPFVANSLSKYKQRVRGLEVNRCVRSQVVSRFLDFEEKWKTWFQGIVQAWSKFMGGSRHVSFDFDIACTQMKQVGSSMHWLLQ